jgi:hypothetical protein
LKLRDVLHLSLYPVGAGVFTGAALTLVASGVVALLVAIGFIPDIKFDFTQWGGQEQLAAIKQRALDDCLKQESFVFTILAAGLQEAYTQLRPPIDALSYLRPLVVTFYLVIASFVFRAAVDHRKGLVFGLVFVAALIATGATALALSFYLNRKIENSDCQKNLLESSLSLMRESTLKRYARDLEETPLVKGNPLFDISINAEGSTLNWIYRLKTPVDLTEFYRLANQQQKFLYERRCEKTIQLLETHTFYNYEGERLTSFAIDHRADCPVH